MLHAMHSGLSSLALVFQLRVFRTSSEPQFQVFAVPLRQGRQLIQQEFVGAEITDVVGESTIHKSSDFPNHPVYRPSKQKNPVGLTLA